MGWQGWRLGRRLGLVRRAKLQCVCRTNVVSSRVATDGTQNTHTHHTISNVLNAAQLFISNADAQMWWIAREARCGPPGHPQKPPAKGAESLATGPKHNRRWRESTSKNRCVYGEERAIGFVRRVDVAFVYMFDWNPPAIALRTRVWGEWLFASFDRIEHSRCVWVTTSAVAWFCYCCWCYGWC